MKIQRVYLENQLQLIGETDKTTSKSLRNKSLVDISFQDIKYTVCMKQPDKKKIILNRITGICPGGKMTAILGSSGAGKTTLLNILAGRVASTLNTELSGKLLANQAPYDYDKFSQFASYVMQNDVLMETMTPKEIFQFAADLKYTDPQIRQSRVEETIKCLKLGKCQNTIIGGITMKGISGGEKKRASIGYELVSNPSCILLDEPTSGLDSFTAFQIIYTLKQLAEQQDRTIIFTIHQPSTDIFNMFDRIMLLVQGKFIYQGPKDQIVNYFGEIGFKCPDHSNPMDYLLKIMHSETQANVNEFPKYFENYDQKLAIGVQTEIHNSNDSSLPCKTFDNSQFYQIQVITKRNYLTFTRNPMQLKTRIITAIFQGLLLGSVFWNVADNDGTTSEMFSTAGALFFLVFTLNMGAVLSVILGFAPERDVFLREENSKLYTTFSYFVGKQVIEIPFCLLIPLIQVLICFWMCSFNDQDSKTVLIFLLISVLIFICADSLGLMVSCVFTDIMSVTNIAPLFLIPMVVFSGFFANTKTLPKWIAWIQYTGPITYGFQSLSINEFQGRTYEIDPISHYDFTIGLWQCISILVGFTLAFRLLGYFFLYGLRTKLQ